MDYAARKLAGCGVGFDAGTRPTLVSHVVDLREERREIDAPGAGLAPSRRIGELDVADPWRALAQDRRRIVAHHHGVIEVALQEEVVGAHFVDDPHRFG